MKQVTIALALAAALGMGSAHAGWEVGAGAAKEIDGESTGLVTVSYVTPHPKFPWEFMAGVIDGRHSIDSGRVPDTVFAGVSKRYWFDQHWYGSFGVVANDEDSDVLSGHLQFQSALGWHGERVGVSLRHLSNGGIEGRNRGETFVLLQLGF